MAFLRVEARQLEAREALQGGARRQAAVARAARDQREGPDEGSGSRVRARRAGRLHPRPRRRQVLQGGADGPHRLDARADEEARAWSPASPATSSTRSSRRRRTRVGADFYVKTFNSAKYWSAGPALTPDPNWKPTKQQLVQSEFNGETHDNLWETTPRQTAEFMHKVAEAVHRLQGARRRRDPPARRVRVRVRERRRLHLGRDVRLPDRGRREHHEVAARRRHDGPRAAVVRLAWPIAAAVAAAVATSHASVPPPVTQSRLLMGTLCEVQVYHDDAAAAGRAAAAALDAMERTDALLSNYKPDSELSAMNRDAARAPFHASAELFDFVTRCAGYHRATDGAFDPTVGPLVRAWGFMTQPSLETVGRNDCGRESTIRIRQGDARRRRAHGRVSRRRRRDRSRRDRKRLRGGPGGGGAESGSASVRPW